MIHNIFMTCMMIFGFGFVVFFHELGHFMAAKWVGIRVEQFAVGFGQALFAYRKKMGWRFGSTNKEVKKICSEHLAKQGVEKQGEPETEGGEPTYSELQIHKAMDELGYGETEYRLNWMPLGGYVKMLGQDDTNAAANNSAPNSFSSKSISARMLVVSAGVVMNIILAAIGFMYIFINGISVPSPIVGTVYTNSPAQKAGIQVGDRILRINGKTQPDFNSLTLSVALMKKDQKSVIEVERTDPDTGKKNVVTIELQPEKMSAEAKGLLGMGIGPSATLNALEQTPEQETESIDAGHMPELDLLKSGDTIVAVNGKPVAVDRYDILYRALQGSNGEPVDLTIRSKAGERHAKITPILEQSVWGAEDAHLEFAGMEPRVYVPMIQKESAAANKILPGDVIVGLKLKDLKLNPSNKEVRELFKAAGSTQEKISVIVERNGEVQKPIEDLVAKTKIDTGSKKFWGMGLGLGLDMKPVTSNVFADSPAGKAKIPSGFRIAAVDGKPVETWIAVRNLLVTSTGKHVLTGPSTDGKAPENYTIELQQSDVDALSRIQTNAQISLEQAKELRITKSPITAAMWGVRETRDFVLQFYVTLRRMTEGSVPVNAMMGPLGIVSSGAAIAKKGSSWLVWFLAMISANLAVVNFLPIPIVDGGLFTFLVIEKLKGKPLSPRFLNAAQMVGLAIILSIFLLVTFQDIKNMIGF